jgi:hypothetical protein
MLSSFSWSLFLCFLLLFHSDLLSIRFSWKMFHSCRRQHNNKQERSDKQVTREFFVGDLFLVDSILRKKWWKRVAPKGVISSFFTRDPTLIKCHWDFWRQNWHRLNLLSRGFSHFMSSVYCEVTLLSSENEFFTKVILHIKQENDVGDKNQYFNKYLYRKVFFEFWRVINLFLRLWREASHFMLQHDNVCESMYTLILVHFPR